MRWVHRYDSGFEKSKSTVYSRRYTNARLQYKLLDLMGHIMFSCEKDIEIVCCKIRLKDRPGRLEETADLSASEGSKL